MRYFVTIDGDLQAIDVAELPGGGYEVRLLDAPDAEVGTGKRLEAHVSEGKAGLTVHLGGRVLDVVVDGRPPELDVFASGRRASVRVESERQRAALAVKSAGAGSGGVVVSPMPGKVVKVLVAEGDQVEAGAPVVVVEAMKMENELVATVSGRVVKVLVAPGEAVEGGARLVEVG
jgi:biotin carboxyl carrier protein